MALAKRAGAVEPMMMTGGVAKNVGVLRALEQKMGCALEVADSAQVNGAIGAAVLAADLLKRSSGSAVCEDKGRVIHPS